VLAVFDAIGGGLRRRPRDDGPDQGRFVGTPEQCVEQLQAYRELGVGDFLILARPPMDEETITRFAREVAPALRAA
jgi:alkanesulfonate monooxygenase SsuD/methylene tetrahydromethanopterin reductase-like flavin-dependent oxidoreductase (luciferase family)